MTKGRCPKPVTTPLRVPLARGYGRQRGPRPPVAGSYTHQPISLQAPARMLPVLERKRNNNVHERLPQRSFQRSKRCLQSTAFSIRPQASGQGYCVLHIRWELLLFSLKLRMSMDRAV